MPILFWLYASADCENESVGNIKVESLRCERQCCNLCTPKTMMNPRAQVVRINAGDEVRGEPEVELLVG